MELNERNRGVELMEDLGVMPKTTKRPSDFSVEEYVLYIPEHLLAGNRDEMIKYENLGVVTSTTFKYVFVKYEGIQARATSPEYLYKLKDRPDLVARTILKLHPELVKSPPQVLANKVMESVANYTNPFTVTLEAENEISRFKRMGG